MAAGSVMRELERSRVRSVSVPLALWLIQFLTENLIRTLCPQFALNFRTLTKGKKPRVEEKDERMATVARGPDSKSPGTPQQGADLRIVQ